MKNGFWKKAGPILIALSVLLSLTSIPLASAQSTQSPTFSIQSYPLLGNSHIAVDLNGDGCIDALDFNVFVDLNGLGLP